MTIEHDIPLKTFASLGVGGPADYFVRVTSVDEIAAAVAFAREKNVPYFLLGGGTNILFADAGFRGLVIRNELKTIDWRESHVTVGSGLALGALVAESVKRGLAGLVELAGLPGTVGGAVAGNAGSYGREIGELVTHARILTPRGIESVDREYFAFRYRHSRLKDTHDILLDVTLALSPTTLDLKEQLWQITRKRAAKEPGGRTAGSWFQNPPGDLKAWELIDSVGLRAACVGGACVAEKHANYLINTGNAKAADFLALSERISEAVFATHGIRLEREVIVIGETFMTKAGQAPNVSEATK